jgi:hypothetical protein
MFVAINILITSHTPYRSYFPRQLVLIEHDCMLYSFLMRMIIDCRHFFILLLLLIIITRLALWQ